MNYEEWFPTTIHYDIIDVDGLEKKAYKLKKESDGRIVSNKGGWQSDELAHSKLLSKLVDDIEQKALEIHDKSYQKNTGKYKVVGIWININNSKAFNTHHVHPDSDLCGVVYVTTPNDCGNIFFDDPRTVHRMNEHKNEHSLDNRYSYTEIKYKPEVGKILFFPNWLYHGVEPNNSDKDRISIAFNMKYESKLDSMKKMIDNIQGK